MSKKSAVIILILSVVVTYGVAIMDFVFNITSGEVGLPFGFSRFNFLSSETNLMNLILDIIFWFLILLIGWIFLQKVLRK
jgi:hypothetical protein